MLLLTHRKFLAYLYKMREYAKKHKDTEDYTFTTYSGMCYLLLGLIYKDMNVGENPSVEEHYKAYVLRNKIMKRLEKYHQYVVPYTTEWWFPAGDWNIRLQFLEEVIKVERSLKNRILFKLGFYKFPVISMEFYC